MGVERVRDLCREVGKLHRAGDPAKAAQLAEEAVAICRQTLGDRHYSYPLTLAALAACRLELAEHEVVKGLLARILVAARDLHGEDFEHARTALTHAAEMYAALGEKETALGIWQELVRLTGEAWGFDHPRYFAARARLQS